MNMKLLEVVTPPSVIYHDCSKLEILWDEKFTPVNKTSCGRHNVRKNREINNGEKYIMLDINYNLDCMNKGEVISSESNDFMGRPGKGMMTSLALSKKGKKK